jgi:hypothetical protein
MIRNILELFMIIFLQIPDIITTVISTKVIS